jgi:hypothetical protein
MYVGTNLLYVKIIFFIIVTRGGKQNSQHNYVLSGSTSVGNGHY